MTVDIRQAGAGEAAEIAAFHVTVWRQTYGGIAPPLAIERLDAAHRLPGWRAALALPWPERRTLVAVQDGAIVGLVSYGAPGAGVYGGRGEVKHLYVDAGCRGCGLGRRLLERARRDLAGAGYDGTALAVVRDNHAALAFYRAMGGEAIAAFTDPGPLWKSDNLLVAWRRPEDQARSARDEA